MPRGFEKLIINPSIPGAEPPLAFVEPRPGTLSFDSDEAAARYYLNQRIVNESRPTFWGLTDDFKQPTPSTLPNLRLKQQPQKSELTKTTFVKFEQTKSGVPVFGSRAVVELDQEKNLVSAALDIADVGDLGTQESLSPEQAKEKLTEFCSDGEGSADIAPPTKIYFHHPTKDTWHLAWYFQSVPLAPQDEQHNQPPINLEVMGHFHLPADYDYFVDAHSGDVLYYFSNTNDIEIPTWCRGQDEEGQIQTFFGRRNGTVFEMHNPFEDVRTYDLGLQKIEFVIPPATPIQNLTADWQDSNRAAVSAHVNATKVLKFLFSVLRRKSIDDQGMPLRNIVNCSSKDAENHPEWKNATWYRDRMWYGQESLGNDRYRSLSRHLDIIAHELTHGVTAHTANLVYRDLSGALNESISDIFGVIIANWQSPNATDPDRWIWEIGKGLGAGGAAMRSMRDPSSVGQWYKPDENGELTKIVDGYPDHMNDYVALPAWYDGGGVHIFSNIHNRAAYLVLTSKRNGNYVFTPEEVSVLYYLTLTRLTRLSDFSDARSELLAVVSTVYAGDPARLEAAQDAVNQAYDEVGIL